VIGVIASDRAPKNPTKAPFLVRRPASVARLRDRCGEVAIARIGASSPCACSAVAITCDFHSATKPSEACITAQPPQLR
jgi:hypothetical protein